MNLTTEEKYTLSMLLKDEIREVEDLIASADEADKRELGSHLDTVKKIFSKLN